MKGVDEIVVKLVNDRRDVQIPTRVWMEYASKASRYRDELKAARAVIDMAISYCFVEQEDGGGTFHDFVVALHNYAQERGLLPEELPADDVDAEQEDQPDGERHSEHADIDEAQGHADPSTRDIGRQPS